MMKASSLVSILLLLNGCGGNGGFPVKTCSSDADGGRSLLKPPRPSKGVNILQWSGLEIIRLV